MDNTGDHTVEFLQDEKLSELRASKKSLNNYESKTLKSILPQVIATVIACSFNMVVGTGLAYSAVLIPAIEDPQSDIKATIEQTSWIASIMSLFISIAGLPVGPLMDKIGRLNTVRLAIVPNVVGWIFAALATNTTMLIVSRAIIGFSAAVGINPVSVYITEIARPDLRAALLSVLTLFSSIGMELLYLQGFIMNWRTIAWTCVVYTIVPFVLLFFTYESPSWLVSKGKTEKAKRSLEWFHKYQDHVEGQSVAQIHLSILQKEHELEMESKRQQNKEGGSLTIIRAFLRPTVYKPSLILIGLFAVQQFSGIYVILLYSVTFFQGVGANINPYIASIFIGGIMVVMSIVNMYTLKRFRKKPLMLSSCLVMAICLFISGYFTKRIHEGTAGLSWVPVTFLLLYVISSMWGMGSLPWTMFAEMYPLDVRGAASSVLGTCVMGIMFAAIQTYRSLDAILGGAHGVQFFYGVVSIMAFAFIYMFVPETYGKKLSEIEDYFKSK